MLKMEIWNWKKGPGHDWGARETSGYYVAYQGSNPTCVNGREQLLRLRKEVQLVAGVGLHLQRV